MVEIIIFLFFQNPMFLRLHSIGVSKGPVVVTIKVVATTRASHSKCRSMLSFADIWRYIIIYNLNAESILKHLLDWVRVYQSVSCGWIVMSIVVLQLMIQGRGAPEYPSMCRVGRDILYCRQVFGVIGGAHCTLSMFATLTIIPKLYSF